MPNWTTLRPDWPRLRDCWQREHRTISRVCGEVASDGRATPPVWGWGVICTGELIFGDLESLKGRRRGGGKSHVFELNPVGRLSPVISRFTPVFFSKSMMIWLDNWGKWEKMGKKRDTEYETAKIFKWSFLLIIFPLLQHTKHGVIRISPPSLADHQCGIHLGRCCFQGFMCSFQ